METKCYYACNQQSKEHIKNTECGNCQRAFKHRDTVIVKSDKCSHIVHNECPTKPVPLFSRESQIVLKECHKEYVPLASPEYICYFCDLHNGFLHTNQETNIKGCIETSLSNLDIVNAVCNGDLDIVGEAIFGEWQVDDGEFNHAKETQEKKDYLKSFLVSQKSQITSHILQYSGLDIHIPLISIVENCPDNKKEKMVELLVSAGVDVNTTGGHLGHSALMRAVIRGDMTLIKALIKYGANINSFNPILSSDKKTALTYAIEYRSRPEIINVLINAAVTNIDKASYQGSSDAMHRTLPNALVQAVRLNDEKLVKTLIESKANFEKDFYDILGLTLMLGHQVPAEMMIVAGATKNFKNMLGEIGTESIIPPVFYAAKHSCDLLKLIVENSDADIINSVHEHCFYKSTLLHCALMDVCSSIDRMKLLVGLKVNINARNGFGLPPLYFAIKRADTGILKFLLDNGADVNPSYKDIMINTPKLPLHLAVDCKSEDVFSFLLNNGADTTLVDENGVTCLNLLDNNISEHSYYLKMRQLLISNRSF